MIPAHLHLVERMRLFGHIDAKIKFVKRGALGFGRKERILTSSTGTFLPSAAADLH